jgi:GT2 family glycosyltransferase
MNQKSEDLTSIIIVNYNSEAYTTELIRCVASLNLTNIEIILVDNHSNNFKKGAYLEILPELIVIECQKNLGFAGANNLGYYNSKGKYIFFLNNDTIITNDLIPGLKAILDQNSDIGAISPIIISFPDDKINPAIQYAGCSKINAITGRNITYHNIEDSGQEMFETGHLHGAALMIKRSVYEKVKLMSEDYFLYYEEMDLSTKIKNHGYKIMVSKNHHVLHHGSVSTGKNTMLKNYYLLRGRIIYMRKWGSSLFIIYIIVISTIKLLVYLILGKWPLFKNYLKASYDGFAQKL